MKVNDAMLADTLCAFAVAGFADQAFVRCHAHRKKHHLKASSSFGRGKGHGEGETGPEGEKPATTSLA